MKELYIILIVIVIMGVIFWNSNEKQPDTSFKITKDNIGNIQFIKRDPNINKLIGKLIDEKAILYSDAQQKVMKNPYQAYYVDSDKIQNISASVNTHVNGFPQEIETVGNAIPERKIPTIRVPVNNFQYQSQEYDDIMKKLTTNFPAENTCNTVPEKDNYLTNYYYDVYGNRIKANMADYQAAYNTLMDLEMGGIDDKVCLPVTTMKGGSDFVIPQMYNYESTLTDAYNVDWSRIENPLSIY
jgi:hypothetical protein